MAADSNEVLNPFSNGSVDFRKRPSIDEETRGEPSISTMHSLHGSQAATRRATNELLFFASVGDVVRCQRICKTWNVDVKDAKCRDYDFRTPQHLAAAEGSFSVLQWLLDDCKAEVNPVDRFQRTPLEDALRGDHVEVVRLLGEHGGKVWKDGALVDFQNKSVAGALPEDEPQLQPEYEIDPKDLELLDKVGEGEFGSVHRGKWHGTVVAIKVLRRSDEVALGDFRTELNVLQKVHHPHAVQFLGACTVKQPYMIVTEFLPGGSVSDLLKSVHTNTARIRLRRGLTMALQCARGMLYLHSRSKGMIIHRDLKPANLMLASPPAMDRPAAQRIGVIKIADFGLSKTLQINSPGRSRLDDVEEEPGQGLSAQRYKLTGETGSYRYMAPEVYRHEPYNGKVDVYAWSMITFELVEGWIPFMAVHPISAAKQAAYEGKRPLFGEKNRWGEVMPNEVRQLVESCWDADFDKRPGFEEICSTLEAALVKLPPQSEEDLNDSSGCCSVM